MRVTLHIVGVALLAFTARAFAQGPAPADFSGDWLLDPARTTTTGSPARAGGPGRLDPATMTQPVKIKDVPPKYPPDALRSRTSGLLILDATIDTAGNVVDLDVLRGDQIFWQAAIDAVSQWKYRPATINGVAVPITMAVTVTFSVGGPPGATAATMNSLRNSMPAAGIGGRGTGGGVGMGPVPVLLSIDQDTNRIRVTRPSETRMETATYRLDNKPTKGKFRNMGSAVGDAEVTFVSRWDGPRLVTTISWRSPFGPQERTETMSVEGQILTVQISRPPLTPGADPIVRTAYYMRKAK